MRIFYFLITALILSTGIVHAQKACFTDSYLDEQVRLNPLLEQKFQLIEDFIRLHQADEFAAREQGQQIIKIPVVFHILYHNQGENVSDSRVQQQIEILNESFRRRNADSVKTPAVFQPVAADCGIEFYLATSDPQGRATTGIVRKYTPLDQWMEKDDMKYSERMGAESWDPASYLNIWVCDIKGLAGYASWPGGEPTLDGVVINFKYIGKTGYSGYEEGRVTVHEVGHWLGLKHIWGDENCGDDLVHDTPQQAFYNLGCPSGTRITCNNGPHGDMYMNYMDYTSDRCINLFTEGQRARMRSLFAPGGARFSILSSKGLNPPTVHESPLPEEPPRWLYTKVYPNPASTELTIDVSYDVRWLGKSVKITSASGQRMMQFTLSNKIQQVDISRLRPGVYILSSQKEDGEVIRLKFVKA